MHEVETMFYNGTTPWHGLGTYLPDYATTDISQCMEAAGLNWTVSLKSLYVDVGHDWPHYVPAPGYATVRSSDDSILGIVGSRYDPLQNVDAFRVFQPFLDSGLATLHTAGSLRAGTRVWVLARIKGDPLEVVRDDVIERFILLSHSHDGTLCIRFGFTPTRVVCANTLRMAHGNDASKLIRFKHTKNALNNLETVRDTINVFNNEFEATVQLYQHLASQQISKEDLQKYMKIIFPNESTRSNNQINRVLEYLETAPGAHFAPGSKWSAYNAVTYYLNYDYGRTQENRLNSLWYGTAGDLALSALLS